MRWRGWEVHRWRPEHRERRLPELERLKRRLCPLVAQPQGKSKHGRPRARDDGGAQRGGGADRRLCGAARWEQVVERALLLQPHAEVTRSESARGK
eukprot:4702034-Pleurochrysis_carterae.AAC.1